MDKLGTSSGTEGQDARFHFSKYWRRTIEMRNAALIVVLRQEQKEQDAHHLYEGAQFSSRGCLHRSQV